MSGDFQKNCNVAEIAAEIKADSFLMASVSGSMRDEALRKISDALAGGKEAIFAANKEDIDAGIQNGLSEPLLKRLKFDQQKLNDCIDGIAGLISLPDPLFQKIFVRELDEGLTLEKVTCPIGVIGVIFESRPDALVQIAALCLKSGNCAILKGGSEAINTNRALFRLIHGAGLEAGIPKGFLTLIETRADTQELLGCHDSIDLLIPRGSNEFVRHIMNNSSIPVMGHSDGVCHIYADKAFDLEKAIPIIHDAKTQYVAACNAAETLLVHRDAAARLLPPLFERLDSSGVTVRGCPETLAIIPAAAPASSDDFAAEYLDFIISVKIVGGIDEAISHINRFGSHHTDCIITEDAEAAERFMLLVDSAGVYLNCSTRFADGFRYGFGAEVGISTGKLHARGPVGLAGLVTYKFKLYGSGQIVGDYASGKRSFKFRDIQPERHI
ncbi:MAG: glutamate-5-semialdehyde dehydrogenase [Clostridiales Family XIII bacterium]|jgi:glutamate-5-semialdehyde dehydrogenase|nr:glutamate-5-semialdehyde dehydrogenase [Clostridiales Family XIII bacterium]